MATLLKVLNNLADIKSAGGVALRVRTQVLDHQSVIDCVWMRIRFFVLAPALKYPLGYGDAINIMKILVPIFASYVGAATLFVMSGENADDMESSEPKSKMLGLLVRWPVIVFLVGLVALIVAFPLSNSFEFNGEGMTPNTLSLFVSILSALLAGITGAISSYLFKVEKSRHGKK